MSDAFLTGFFTLSASLSTIWLNNHLLKKDDFSRRRRKRAVQAYQFCTYIPDMYNNEYFLFKEEMIKRNIFLFDLKKMNKEHHKAIDKLELILMIDFPELRPFFKKISGILCDQFEYFIEINNKMGMKDEKKFDDILQKLDDDRYFYFKKLLDACTDLKMTLLERHINPKHAIGWIKKNFSRFKAFKTD